MFRSRAAVRAVRAAVLAVAVACAAEPARADETQAANARATALEHLTAGRDLLRTAPAIAGFEGAWSFVLQLDTLLTSRRWDAPYPQGLVAQEATRVLFGSTWTTLLALEAAAASLASGGRFDWLAEAHYRTDWTFGAGAAACPGSGAFGGCGVGIGSFGGLHVRPVGSRFWFEVTGGWLEQRIASDSRRTLEESAWVLTPMSVTYAAAATLGPLRADARIGPGAYFGMHSAHVHPTTGGVPRARAPWHELYPLDAGVGPGGRVELGLGVVRTLRFALEAVAAPLVAGTRRTRTRAELLPLAGGDTGVPWWRAVTASASVSGRDWPLTLGVAVFAAELSSRPIEKLGSTGCMLRFDFPLRAAPAHE